jgi:hypothetical protein
MIHLLQKNPHKVKKNQPIRLPGLKPEVCSGLILHFDKTQCPEPVEGSGAFYPNLKIGVWRRRTYQGIFPKIIESKAIRTKTPFLTCLK